MLAVLTSNRPDRIPVGEVRGAERQSIEPAVVQGLDGQRSREPR
jgi:hypothetical protein